MSERKISDVLKISFCTVCMNRIDHLMATLPKNISDNDSYTHCSFILLDYNSTDGLEEWVKQNMSETIATGKLIYYKILDRPYFHRSHSRNVVFKLADGDILCNVDADNYTGKGFADYINRVFVNNEHIFLTAQASTGKMVSQDVMGRIALRSNDFYSLRGYDESLTGYGYEDHDLIGRMEMANLKRHVIDDPNYLQAIIHDNTLRISNEYLSRNVERVLFSHIDPAISEILLLYRNGRFERRELLSNKIKNSIIPSFTFQTAKVSFDFELCGREWQTGQWESNDYGNLTLHDAEATTEVLQAITGPETAYRRSGTASTHLYYEADQSLQEDIMFFYTQAENRERMFLNQRNQHIVNAKAFGEGIVYKNSQYDQPIQVS